MPVWRNPAAWFGLIALAIPILVHLLARMRAQVIAFPSLRFIDASRLAARRRRTLSDLPLLALRLLALLLAVAACANPLFLTASRRAAWSARVSRAIVIDTSASVSRVAKDDDIARAADREAHDAFRSTTLRSTSLPDAVPRAIAWLRIAPPSRREIVLLSDFQEDTITPALLRDVPDDVGVRFVRVGARPRDATADARPVTMRSASGFGWTRAQVRVDAESTAIVGHSAAPQASTPPASAPPASALAGSSSPSAAVPASAPTRALAPISVELTGDGVSLDPFGLRVIAKSAADRQMVRAVLEAVLAEGVPAPAAPDRRVELILPAADAAAPAAPGPVSAPWMADALHGIATDPMLTAAVAGSTINPDASADRNTGAKGNAGGHSGGTDHADSAAPAAPVAAAAQGPWLALLRDRQGTPGLLAGADGRQLILVARTPGSAPVTPLLFRAVLRALGQPDPLPEADVRTIADSALRTWTRPASQPSIDALRNVEDSDRRWFWAAALVVLLVETWLRRDRQRGRTQTGPVEVHEHAA